MYQLASGVQDNIKKYKPISPRSILPMNYKLRLAKPVGPHFPDVSLSFLLCSPSLKCCPIKCVIGGKFFVVDVISISNKYDMTCDTILLTIWSSFATFIKQSIRMSA